MGMNGNVEGEYKSRPMSKLTAFKYSIEKDRIGEKIEMEWLES